MKKLNIKNATTAGIVALSIIALTAMGIGLANVQKSSAEELSQNVNVEEKNIPYVTIAPAEKNHVADMKYYYTMEEFEQYVKDENIAALYLISQFGVLVEE